LIKKVFKSRQISYFLTIARLSAQTIEVLLHWMQCNAETVLYELSD